MPIRVGRQWFSRHGGGGGAGGNVPSSGNTLDGLESGSDLGIDLKVVGNDIRVQFTDNVSTAFDPTTGLYYPTASAFGTEVIGPPLGSIAMMMQAVTGNSTVNIQTAALPSYGGTKQMCTWDAVASKRVRYWDLATVIGTGDDFTVVVMCKYTATNNNIATVCQLTQSDAAPSFRLNHTAGQVAQLNMSNNAGSAATAASGTAMTAGEWNLLAGSYSNATNVGTLYQFSDLKGSSSTTTAKDIDATLDRLYIGGNASDAQPFQGSIAWVYVTRQQLTGTEIARMYGPNALPAPLCPDDTTKTILWVPMLSDAPKVDYCSNRSWVAVSGAEDSHVAFATNTAPSMLACNRLQIQTSSTTKQHAFTGSDSTAASLGTAETGIHLGNTSATLDADVGTAPDPDNANATSIATTRRVLVGGGPQEKISVQSHDGSSSGTLNLSGVTYAQAAGTQEWVNMTLTNAALAAPSGAQIDFEMLWNGGPEDDYKSWRDPNNANSSKICFLKNLAGTVTGQVGELDQVYGDWLNKSDYGSTYSLGTWDGIGTAIKAPHFCLVADAPYKIAGIITSDAGSGSATQAVVRTLTFDGAGAITGGSNDVLGDAKAALGGATLGVKNALGSQNPADTQIYMCGALGGTPARNIGYIGEDDETWKAITNAESSDANVGFRFVRRASYIITTDTTGAHEGQMRWTKYTDDTTGLITTTSNYVGQGGSDFDFDAQGWFAPEGDGQTLWFLGQTASRTTLRFYYPTGTGFPISSSYGVYRDCPVPAAAGAATGTWYWQSPEPVSFNGKSYMLCTLKDVDNVTDSVVSAHKTQIWLMGADGTTLRCDRSVSDGVARISHEAEYSHSQPDSIGRVQLLVYINECNIGETATKTITLCRTGMFYTPAIANNFTPFVRDTRAFPLYGSLIWPSGAEIPFADRVFSDDEKTYLASQLDGWWSGNDTDEHLRPEAADLDFMRTLNPDMYFLAYNNSAYSLGRIDPTNYVQEVEADRLNIIQVYKEGTLATNLNNTDTTSTLTVTATTGSGALVNSSSETTDYTIDLFRCVTYIRVGTEIMKILTATATGAATQTLTVQRGFNGTTKATHSIGDNVYAPIYIGATYPNSLLTVSPGPRYAANVTSTQWRDCPLNQRTRMAEFITNAGRDGIHLDIFTPSFTSMNNALGSSVTPWNFNTSSVYTKTERAAERVTQAGMIRTLLDSDTSATNLLVGNNENNDYNTADGGGRLFLSGGSVDGMCWEDFACKSGGFNTYSTGNGNWKEVMADLCDAMQSGYSILVKAKAAEPNSNMPATITDSYAAFSFYDYVNYLLIWEPTNTTARYTFAFVTKETTGPGNWTFFFPDWLYYDIGTPLAGDEGTGDCDDAGCLTPLLVGGTTGTYDREYTRAYVLVNPTTSVDSDVTLPTTNHAHWRDPLTLEDVTVVTPTANFGNVYLAWDFEADDDDPVGTTIGTVQPGTNVAAFGTGPYTFVPLASGETIPFTISTSGVITSTTRFTHVPASRYIMNVRATDSLSATHDYEILIVTKA